MDPRSVEKYSLSPDIPHDITCTICLDLFTDVVMTPLGHCYCESCLIDWLERNATCPQSRAPVNISDLIKDEALRKIILRYDHAQGSRIVQAFNQRKQELLIQRCKLRLQLDLTNIRHLHYWSHHHTAQCFHKRGGVALTHAKTKITFRVPTRIAKMMEAGEHHYEDYNEYFRAIDLIRQTKPRLWNNPFSFFTRKPLTEMIYQTKNLQQIDLSLGGFR